MVGRRPVWKRTGGKFRLAKKTNFVSQRFNSICGLGWCASIQELLRHFISIEALFFLVNGAFSAQ